MAREFAKPFYNSSAWKAVRKQALRRDGYSCHDCGARANEVHHIRELTPLNINDPRVSLALHNLMSLCHECHASRTKKSGDLPEGFSFDASGQPIPPVGCEK